MDYVTRISSERRFVKRRLSLARIILLYWHACLIPWHGYSEHKPYGEKDDKE